MQLFLWVVLIALVSWLGIAMVAGLFFGVLAFLAEFYIPKLTGVNLIGFEFIHSQIRKCVVGGQCPAGDQRIHVLAERVAWFIMNSEKPDWRVIPAVMADIFIEAFFLPLTKLTNR